ncbi:MAG: glutamine--fructose-6-phosphate transaminase (isomerizing) [Alistipes sp.]|nr:glutamine--fructose-6-phosphate transaminase (isomerizing) [Alistipes sp.]MBQ5692275.1 glutamine--fructose-6-phosphate transaminase (isomerizing) [Alistipes sp.]MBQ5855539.1 glutamine--fructose-6-phosphate transaminase (isomerizing) [Alistipes sp.]
MCGIVGYIGKRRAYDVLIQGLHRLEYRGYDSSGVAMITEPGELNIYKSKGKVSALEHFASNKDISGTIGIAHTRWATHGEPNDINAHPHCSQSGRIALVHNGTIENYTVLKEALSQQGFNFVSQTDTEVVVQLIEYIMDNNHCTLFEAVAEATKRVVGAYAIAVIDRQNPRQIVAARQSSPLVIGIGEGEYFLASDATPIIEYTNKVVYLNDGEIAVIEPDKELKVYDSNAIGKNKIEITELQMSIEQLEKGGYPHFMLKEIFEQPRTLADCISGRITADGKRVVLSGVIENRSKFLNTNRIIIVACGTSWHAALIGKHLIEEYCRIPVVVEYASEFRYSNPVVNQGDILIALSQSGETADTLAALELAKQRGAFVFGICNVIGSSIPRATHSGCYIHVGPEIGVASTKAFTGQVTVLAMMALLIGQMKGTVTDQTVEKIATDIRRIPTLIQDILSQSEKIEDLAKIFTYAHNFLYLGRGYNYPSALEGALKLKEISYIHAEGYPAAEMKHGTIALIDNDMPSVVIAIKDNVYDKTVNNIQQVKARGGKVVAIVTEGDTVVRNMADYVIEVPEISECLTPLLTAIPLQLLAYYIAVNKGRDVDQPRNLAKSVTVE